MADVVVGALLSATLQVLFDRMASKGLLEFFKGNKLDEALLEKLKILLLSVSAVLGDAEEKQINDPFVKNWVDKLKEAVYDADDALDQIATKAMQCKVDYESHKTITQVKDYLSSLNFFSERMKDKLERINGRLSSIVEHKYLLGLKEGGGGKPSCLSLPTTCLINELEVYGRNEDKQYIIDLLLSLNEEMRVSVIAIVGMAGMGKTTLSQIVYNDLRLSENFEVKSWVHISEGFSVFEVTKQIHDSLIRSKSNSKIRDLNTLQMELASMLEGKRFLLVLDDYWSESFLEWDLLKRPLEYGHHESCIIVTTRNQSVALTIRAAESYLLPRLSDEDCWDLFAHHAFRGRDPEASPILMEIGEQIVRKCKGHPLAVKTLGSLLAFKSEAKEWNNILQSKMWDIPANKSNILHALRLSYQQLPSNIKRCFAYCSIFPKGYEISKWNLIHLWMAEGLLPLSKNEEKIEDIGEEYINELLSRSFLQQSILNELSVNMHDLMSDLAQHVGGEFFYKLEHSSPHQVPEKVRHLSFLSDILDEPKKFEALYDLSQLRTFLPLRLSNSGRSSSIPETLFDVLLRKMICLRVLSLSNYPITILPGSVGDLKHLRYLNLSRTGLMQLPDSVGCLYNLQTLLLSGCRLLTKLPINLQNLTNLHHLDLTGTNLSEMPPKFSRLKNLQFLTTFVVSRNNGSRISELGALLQLHGALSIVSLQNVVNLTDASEAKLMQKEFLDDLELKWEDGIHNMQKERIVLDNLQPHQNLKRLKIENYGGRMFPYWLGSSSFFNVVSMHLICCRNCSSLPSLGQLPSLRMLYIANMTSLQYVSPEFFGDHTEPFKSLEILTFVDMLNWEEWQVAEDRVFPSLKEFHIVRCPRLAGFLPRVPMLEELELIDCNALVSVPEAMMQDNACLSKLVISNCPYLVSLPIQNISLTLKSLHIFECRNLQLFSLEHATCHYRTLEHLHVESSFDILINFPLSQFTALHDVHILDCCSLESLSFLPEFHQNLFNLKYIEIKDCPDLVLFPEGGLPTPNLQSLSISNCVRMSPQMQWGLHEMASLASFKIESGSNDVQNFPEEGLLPTSLTSLQISRLLNLRSLDQTGLQDLTSLKFLEINGCNMLESLPELGLPHSLTSLIISDCSLLVPLCQRETGPFWNLISGIPYLAIDEEIIISDQAEEQ